MTHKRTHRHRESVEESVGPFITSQTGQMGAGLTLTGFSGCGEVMGLE